MMKKRWKFNGKAADSGVAAPTSSKEEEENEGKRKMEWEMRPGGMLVQRRSENSDVIAAVSVPDLRVRVAFGAMRYEVLVNSQSTFGELKKHLTEETGLQPGDQKLYYRGKERQNGDYLDTCGVKDRSKVILIEDPQSIERRVIETRRNAKIRTAHRLIADISSEVDQLAAQVSAIEKSIANGVKVPELQITTLIEMLMRQAVKLDSISADGDASLQKSSQGKRVQKCVETLDVLKVSNAGIKPAVVTTTKWETFDPPPPQPHSTFTNSNWEIFD